MYLIEKLSKPMVLKSSVDPEEKESTDYESEELRASMSSDFEIICYLRRNSFTNL